MSYTANNQTVLGLSAVAVTAPADTNENILATIHIPAGVIGANGEVSYEVSYNCTNSANNKIVRARLGGIGGTILKTQTTTTQASSGFLGGFGNRNSQSSQVGDSANAVATIGGSSSNLVTSAVNTSVATTIVITGQKAVAGESLVLESYSFKLNPRS